MPQLDAEWPRRPLRDQLGQHGATEGLSGYDQASQEPVGASQGHSVPLRTTSGQYEYVLVSFRNPVLFCKYLSPLKSHKIGSVFKIYIWISVFREKKRFRNLFIGSGDIKQTNIWTFFLKRPVGSGYLGCNHCYQNMTFVPLIFFHYFLNLFHMSVHISHRLKLG